ncbi:hypothetical protein [Prevotella sp. S7-1-8]|uniref:hypothetical protein n=1 Tax=Prevotella sp. S7-1-8 TaxID=1284775 RepID=UPI0012E0B85C|nr:hypothetical protein [Prevotella sp. S7-1-8]
MKYGTPISQRAPHIARPLPSHAGHDHMEASCERFFSSISKHHVQAIQAKRLRNKPTAVIFEDTGNAADGGLRAGLVQNKDFQHPETDRHGRQPNSPIHAERTMPPSEDNSDHVSLGRRALYI